MAHNALQTTIKKVSIVHINRTSQIRNYCLSIILFGLLTPLSTVSADSVKTLQWTDLIPEETVAELAEIPDLAIDHNGGAVQQEMSPVFSAVKKELDGQLVKLPGFMVPLGGDAHKVTEFLLVPYFGACIHTPPPPTNQIVYVNYPKGVNPDMLYDPIWIEGTIKVDEIKSEIAVSGYSMNAIDVTLYE